MAGFVRESAIRTPLPAALALGQHCRRAVRLPAHAAEHRNALAALPVKYETSPKEGFLRIPRLLVVDGCIGKAGNYIYEDKAKKFKFRVQSGPLLIIAQAAFRGVGATSSSISAPATPCRVGEYYRRTGRTPDPAAVSPARSPNVAGARNSVNNDTTQG